MNRDRQKKPEWLKLKLSTGEHFAATRQLLSGLRLNTVCRSAMCPNLQECWSKGTATFMLLGSVCTRTCRFCAVDKTVLPAPPDPGEPEKIALAVKNMNLNHVVLTSVNRDDLADGGSGHWVSAIRSIRAENPEVSIECLIPDFDGITENADRVMREVPEVLNHNIETVPSLYGTIRPQADYRKSLELLERANNIFGLSTKSGMMVGMGETFDQVFASLADLASFGCNMVTIGQYLQPTASHLPVNRYVTPEEFAEYKRMAESLGFRHVQSGPFVRSSYHAAAFVASTPVRLSSKKSEELHNNT
ncbi:MAG: lipoyl synthase [Chlorobium sp.]|uniref:lipoyl synthase n=1 Tax=Chlorobium sp. TaxID=1095 RepID=UPI0025C28A4F|nr:lipoyl synthase [Chlorobium sp.]MCF8382401.1 lipoyl synthase [Chlorobium sp.]